MLHPASQHSLGSDPLSSPDLASLSSPTTMSEQQYSTSDGERQPLLAPVLVEQPKKPFYRARPMWLVPFVVISALVHGLTLAPRVEVYTQLSCNAAQHRIPDHRNDILSNAQRNPYQNQHLYSTLDPYGPTVIRQSNYSHGLIFPIHALDNSEQDEEDPRYLPSHRCLSDPVVQAGAARLSTIMTITMGGLSAITTGWWGRFGERHGRTRVLAITTLGLFLADLIFILASTPHTPLSSHGHKFLILAPLFEGLLGGWTTLQSAVAAYIYDCTSPGSRAQIFSRFTGVICLGLAFGPSVSAFLIQHPVLGVTAHTVTEVFWVAVGCSFVNFVLVLFVFPESLSEEKQMKARDEDAGKAKAAWASVDELEQASAPDALTTRKGGGIVQGFFSPLAVFLPTEKNGPGGKDWSLTFLACALLGYMLSTGLTQISFLYAGHMYEWGADQLNFYISFLSGSRALHLIIILPFLISTFKPKRPTAKSKVRSTENSPSATPSSTSPATKKHLAREIHFDILISRFSLLADLASNVLVMLGPSPPTPDQADMQLQAFFVLASGLTSFGSGTIPAMRSLALCIMQGRALREDAGPEGEVDAGQLFGALAVLQAVGQMILGPLLFGLVYSETVAMYPKAIFVTSGGILVGALAFLSLVRSERVIGKGKRKMKRWEREEAERGRSRVSKDLRGSAPIAGPSKV